MQGMQAACGLCTEEGVMTDTDIYKWGCLVTMLYDRTELV